jgi:uncharacterized SAM-binding protein YcdF (DUF218 family)
MRVFMLKRLAVVLALGACLWPVATFFSRHDPLGIFLSAPLDRRFNQVQPREGVSGILVPSGNSARIGEAIGLARLFPDARVYLIGGEDRFPADLLLRELGDRLVHERLSSTTHENATMAARLITPRAGSLYLLVTDRMHMPRAVGAFRRQGFRVHPWPIISGPASYRLSTRAALYEWTALTYYRLMGWTSALLPAADT